MRAIAIVNQKGGCGKTTTAINLAAVFGRRGARTLLVDMDPQAHCAAGLAVPEEGIDRSVGDALIAEHDASFHVGSCLWEVSRNFHLLPSTTRLAGLEAPGGGLHELPDRDRRLESLLTLLSPHYDVCLIDCPPTIGLLTFNALRAAREALVPVETGFFALRGAQKQWKTIQRLIERLERPMSCHLLPTLHDRESRNAQNVLEALRREFRAQMPPMVIHEHEALREAASYGQPVLEYAPGSEAQRDFETLADWLEERGHTAPTIEVLADSIGSFRTPRMRTAPPHPHRPHRAVADLPAMREHEPLTSGRAGELARRMREMRHIAHTDPAAADAASEAASEISTTERYGVRVLERGVHFIQPGHVGQSVSVAGSFNDWSTTATPLVHNSESGVYEAVVQLPPGRYEYRLVIDGAWTQDEYNAPTEHSKDANSTFIVPEQLQDAP